MAKRLHAEDRTWVGFTSGTGSVIFHEHGTARTDVGTAIDADWYAASRAELILPVGPYFVGVRQVTAAVWPLAFTTFDDEAYIHLSSTTWELARFDPPGADQVWLHVEAGVLFDGVSVDRIGYQIVVEADRTVQAVDQPMGRVEGLVER